MSKNILNYPLRMLLENNVQFIADHIDVPGFKEIEFLKICLGEKDDEVSMTGTHGGEPLKDAIKGLVNQKKVDKTNLKM